MNRRDSIKATASLCLASTVGAAFAQVPAAPIRIIVPAAAGGTVDSMARMLAEAMRPKLGVVVVENKAGAAGLIGTKYVQNGPSDGRTLLFAAKAGADPAKVRAATSRSRISGRWASTRAAPIS